MIDWEIQIKHATTGVWTDVPFGSITLEEKSGMDVSSMSVTVRDKAGYFFSWIKDCAELKVFKNGAEHFHGYITNIGDRAGSKGEEIRIGARNYWHYILKRRLTTFERFGKIRNVNPTELAKVAIGTRTYISDADWEADKINALKFGAISTDVGGDIALKLGVRNNTNRSLMAYLRSIEWRVDEPDWQGSEEMKTVYTTVSETLSGGASYFKFSRDNGETWYSLAKSAGVDLTGSETEKKKGMYKIALWGNSVSDENTVESLCVSGGLMIGNPAPQRIVKTGDGTLHTCVVKNATPDELMHYVSRDNGKTWAKYGDTLYVTLGGGNINGFALAASPSGNLCFIYYHTVTTNIHVVHRAVTDKTKGDWSWHGGSNVYLVTGKTPQSVGIFGVMYHNGTDWKEGFAYVYPNVSSGIEFAFTDCGTVAEKWSRTLDTALNDQPAIWCHKNWGIGASSKPVIFVARSARQGATRACEIKKATYTSGGSPVWDGSWTTIDSGSTHNVDIVSDRVKFDHTTEDYRIYVFYGIGTSLYCKYADASDLSTWTVLTLGITNIYMDYWDVTHLIDQNFLFYFCRPSSNYDLVSRTYREGVGLSAEHVIVSDSVSQIHASAAQESTHGFGIAVGTDTYGGSTVKTWFTYSSIDPKITAMTLAITTDSETGILEGNMASYTNAGLDAEEVDYNMNRETRLAMLQNIQKLMPVAEGASSPYPFWDVALRVEGGIAYLDVAEQLGSIKDVTITHEDETEGDMPIEMLNKEIDRAEIINALTLVGGGWSYGGIEVIPIKNVATVEVQADTVMQLAGTVLNKRQSTDLTIENIAYGILNVTRNPRITIGLSVKGDARDLFTLNDRITVISERADINKTLKIRGMTWGISKGKTTLKLTLDNGAQSLDKYMVEMVSNMNSMGFNSQGELTRPPIFLNKNFSKDEPASLTFYVPATKKTVKALLYVKTEKYTSYENNVINEFGYYPSDVRLSVDSATHDGFGGRGTESAPVNISGMDITLSMDIDEDGYVDGGAHTLRFMSSASTNNPNGIGRIEAYLVLLESEQ